MTRKPIERLSESEIDPIAELEPDPIAVMALVCERLTPLSRDARARVLLYVILELGLEWDEKSLLELARAGRSNKVAPP